MDVRRFLAELKGRGVYRVAALYAAGSWALLQIADVFFPIVGLPDWAITSVLAGAALGFPVAIVLAWVFDMTPEGLVETDAVATNYGRIHLSLARLVELGLLLALVLLVGFLYIERLTLQEQVAEATNNGATGDGRPSVAVMAFQNMSADPNVEYFGDGLAEEILNLLARLNELDVAARTSSFYYKDKDVDLRDVGQKLGVDHILEGSVRRSGDQIRVTAQLIEMETGYHIWSATYDRDFSDSFRIQDDIARKVVGTMQVILSDNSKSILNNRPTVDPQAYDFYLQGREYLRSSLGDADVSSAISLFERAISLDAGYAEAYAGLCDAHLVRYRAELDPEIYDRARSACGEALSLDTKALPIYVALGNINLLSGNYEAAIEEFSRALDINPSAVDAVIGLAETYEMDNKPKLAEENFQRAIALQPNYWLAYQRMGGFLFSAGRFEEAVPYYLRITELMPDSAEAFNDLGAAHYMMGNFAAAAKATQHSLEIAPTALAYSNTGSSLFFLGRFHEAVDMYQKAVEYAPEDFYNWGSLGDAYSYADGLEELAVPMYQNAVKLASERLRVNPQDAITYSLVGYYLARVGEREQALRNMARAVALAPRDMYVCYNNALMLTTLGERVEALQALRTAVSLGYSSELIVVDAGFSSLTALPEYQDLIARSTPALIGN